MIAHRTISVCMRNTMAQHSSIVLLSKTRGSCTRNKLTDGKKVEARSNSHEAIFCYFCWKQLRKNLRG
jgi:hypothetical protein